MAGCDSTELTSQGGLWHRLRDFIVANVWWFSGPLQKEGTRSSVLCAGNVNDD